jgi:hypothetical protein
LKFYHRTAGKSGWVVAQSVGDVGPCVPKNRIAICCCLSPRTTTEKEKKSQSSIEGYKCDIWVFWLEWMAKSLYPLFTSNKACPVIPQDKNALTAAKLTP